MDIEKLIKRLCKYLNDDGIKLREHDRAYEKAIRNSYEKYKHLTDRFDIKNELNNARDRFAKGGSTHTNTADCMVLYEMFQEI